MQFDFITSTLIIHIYTYVWLASCKSWKSFYTRIGKRLISDIQMNIEMCCTLFNLHATNRSKFCNEFDGNDDDDDDRTTMLGYFHADGFDFLINRHHNSILSLYIFLSHYSSFWCLFKDSQASPARNSQQNGLNLEKNTNKIYMHTESGLHVQWIAHTKSLHGSILFWFGFCLIYFALNYCGWIVVRFFRDFLSLMHSFDAPLIFRSVYIFI